MRKVLFILFIATCTTAMAGMSTNRVRQETRFLTDKMAYELGLGSAQYNDVYEINFDFIYSVRNVMDYVVRRDEWAMNEYYDALDIRNDDLRWVLNENQYRRFLGADYFYRPIYVTGGRWSFRIYVNYPNRSLFYYGVPYHYNTYWGAHCRPHFHNNSYYRGRYDFGHYSSPYRTRDQRRYHSYRDSDFGSAHFRPNTSNRPHNMPPRPGNGNNTRPHPGIDNRPTAPERPSRPTAPERPTRPTAPERPSRPTTPERPTRPTASERPSRPTAPSHDNRPNREATPNNNSNRNDRNQTRRSNSNSTPSSSSRRTSSSTEVNRGSNRSRTESSSSSRNNSERNSSSRSSERGNSSRR